MRRVGFAVPLLPLFLNEKNNGFDSLTSRLKASSGSQASVTAGQSWNQINVSNSGCKPQQLSCTGNTICEYSLQWFERKDSGGFPIMPVCTLRVSCQTERAAWIGVFCSSKYVFGINSHKFGTFHRFIQGHDRITDFAKCQLATC